MKGQTIGLPIADKVVQAKAGESVKASLRTRDPREAKTRFSAALTALNDYWEAVRKGPQSLTQNDERDFRVLQAA